jgi:CelD/BcsL family acetyltransferase involved in cellulose biosynthesis
MGIVSLQSMGPRPRRDAGLRQPLRELDTLERLEWGWDRLAAGRASPMQHIVWAQAFAATRCEARAVHVIVVGPDSAPNALAALVQRPGAGMPFQALGDRQLFEPMDVLYDSPEALSALANLLARQGRALYLPRVPADSPSLKAFSAAYRGRGLFRVTPTACYPYLELDESWKEPERKFNASRRSEFRRTQRHAEKHGRPSFEVLAPSPRELRPLLDEAWRVESSGWKSTNGSALTCDPLLSGFFRRYAFGASKKGILRMAFMRIDGRAIAMQLNAECAKRLWTLKMGYDERFANCGPGQQLMLHVVRHAAMSGLQAIEFLGQQEQWAHLWTRTVRKCVAVRAYPFTPPALATFAVDALRFAGRNLLLKWSQKR